MLEIFVSALATLFVVIDPIGIAPIFISLTEGMGSTSRHRVALRAVLISGFVLIMFAALGQSLLHALGITLPAFRIAGGLLLFWISTEMIFEKRQARKTGSAERAVQEDHPDDIAAFPLAVPLMAGPGAITAVILLAGRIEGTWQGIAGASAVIVVVLAVTYALLRIAIRIDQILGSVIRTVITRLLGVLLSALAVQFVADGITQLARAAG